MQYNYEQLYSWSPVIIKGLGAISKSYFIILYVDSEVYGSFAILLASMVLLASFTDLKIPQFINHFKKAIEDNVNIFYGIFGLQVVISIIIFVFFTFILWVSKSSFMYLSFYLLAISQMFSNGITSYFRVNRSSKDYFLFTSLIEIPSLIIVILYLISYEFNPAVFAIMNSIFYLMYSFYLMFYIRYLSLNICFNLLCGEYSSFFRKNYFYNIISFFGDFVKLQLLSSVSLVLLGDYKKAENVFSIISRFRSSLKTVWLKRALTEVRVMFYPKSSYFYLIHITIFALFLIGFVFLFFPAENPNKMAKFGLIYLSSEIILWLMYGVSLRSNAVGIFDYYISGSLIRYTIEIIMISFLIINLGTGFLSIIVARAVSIAVSSLFILYTRKGEKYEFY